MRIKRLRLWIEYEDERGDQYMATATEADVKALSAEKAKSGSVQGEEEEFLRLGSQEAMKSPCADKWAACKEDS